MAHSDKIGRTALGVEPFWDKPSSNPSISLEKWWSQLKMALVAKTNIELDELPQERPTTVIYPPPPRTGRGTTRTKNPRQTMERERMTRYHKEIAKWKNERTKDEKDKLCTQENPPHKRGIKINNGTMGRIRENVHPPKKCNVR